MITHTVRLAGSCNHIRGDPYRHPYCVKISAKSNHYCQSYQQFCTQQLLSRPFPFKTIVQQIALKLNHTNSFQDHHILVYFQHNGRTAHIPNAHIPLALSRQHFRSGRVMSPSHWKGLISPKKDGMPASLVSWAPKASSNGNISRYPKMMMLRNTLITCSRSSLTL